MDNVDILRVNYVLPVIFIWIYNAYNCTLKDGVPDLWMGHVVWLYDGKDVEYVPFCEQLRTLCVAGVITLILSFQ